MSVRRSDVLRPHSTLDPPAGPVVLIVMDGVGCGRNDEFDAVYVARTPHLDALRRDHLVRTVRAHGPAVGLQSDSDMGNSEVGHNTMGAGRIFDQGAKRIDGAIRSGVIWTGEWAAIVNGVRTRRSNLHLIGLVSDGNVHASLSQLFALINRAALEGVQRVYVHALLDGRDVPDHSAHTYIAALESQLEAAQRRTGGVYRIASGGGRMVTTMDRYAADWRIVERGWRAHVLGAARGFTTAGDAIATLRAESPGISDQLLPAFTIVDDGGNSVGAIQNGDAVILFNFRGDRAMELAQALAAGSEFPHFDRVRVPEIQFAGMTLYDGDTGVPERRLVEPEPVPNTVSEYLARAGVTQWAGAETQKFGHVTYFWNGNRSEPFEPSTETYVEIASDQVPFDERPSMKSVETADSIVAAIRTGRFALIRANFPGGDMVGHTGSFDATVSAVEAIDVAIGRIRAEAERCRGALVITADHGNAEDMVERDSAGKPLRTPDGIPRWKTAHSTNPVPMIIAEYGGRRYGLRDDLPEAGLSNLAGTLVELLGFEPPTEYDPSLLAVGQPHVARRHQ